MIEVSLYYLERSFFSIKFAYKSILISMALFRLFLVALLMYLLLRAFALYNREEERRRIKEEMEQKISSKKVKKISDDTGEFVDYEEVE